MAWLPEGFDWRHPSYSEIIRRRAKMLDKIRADTTGQTLAAFKRHYKNNFVDFINDWMWTHDPRKQTMPYRPFLLFPRQEEYIHWLNDRYAKREDGLTEKSREMGVTWLCCAYATCLWLFRPGSKIGFGSRKEELVDKLGDPDSIFEKVRYLLRTIPPEFLPIGYSEQNDAPHLKIINRMNGSTMTGEGGDNIGRGGRNSIYFKDESAFYARPERVDAALSQNSDVKIDVSTPNGAGNPFYEKRRKGKLPVFTFHWKQDPRKDQAWYDYQVETSTPFTVAQEIDIDYEASREGVLIPAQWIRAAVGLKLPKLGAKKAALDVADEEGSDCNALALGQGVVIESIQTWNGIDTTQTARKAWLLAMSYHAQHIHYDCIGVGAGVRGELKSLSRLEDEKPAQIAYRPAIRPVDVGLPPEEGTILGDRTNKDTFGNAKAFYWWGLRLRFFKTYQHVNNIKKYPLDELISIPDDPQLIAELSQPGYEVNEAGRIMVESKKAMRTRGVKSPNKADAVVLYFVKPYIPKVWG